MVGVNLKRRRVAGRELGKREERKRKIRQQRHTRRSAKDWTHYSACILERAERDFINTRESVHG